MTLENRVPKGHPLRSIKKMADEVLEELSGTLDYVRPESRSATLRGIRKTQLMTHLAGAAYNLLRMAKLEAES